MKKTEIQSLKLSTEVRAQIENYTNSIDRALAAAQKLESIYVTKHLAQQFGVADKRTAQIIQSDYLTTA